MPPVRRFGNLVLSFLAKLSSGYWTIMDPTNGFFAIHARVAELLDDERIAKRFFFETDLLFHLGLIRAKVVEFPMLASYGSEVSNLRVSHQLRPFLAGHVRNASRRILYRYFFRDLSWLRCNSSQGRRWQDSVWFSGCTIGGWRRRISWCPPALS